MVGIGGLTPSMAMVLEVGQLTRLGVTTMVYVTSELVPTGTTGVIIEDEYVLALPASQTFGVQLYEYCDIDGAGVNVMLAAILLPGQRVAVIGLTLKA